MLHLCIHKVEARVLLRAIDAHFGFWTTIYCFYLYTYIYLNTFFKLLSPKHRRSPCWFSYVFSYYFVLCNLYCIFIQMNIRNLIHLLSLCTESTYNLCMKCYVVIAFMFIVYVYIMYLCIGKYKETARSERNV